MIPCSKLRRWFFALALSVMTWETAQARNPVRLEPRDLQAKMSLLEFTSDHNLMRRDGADLLTCGDRYPDIEWTAKDADSAAAMTHTQARHMEARVLLKFNRLPQGTVIKLRGDSETQAFSFEGEGKVEQTGPLASTAVVYVKSKDLLPAQLRRLQATINWNATIEIPGENAREVDLATSGPHVCYLTRGTPHRAEEKGSEVTARRMQVSYERMALALENAPENPSAVGIVHALTSYVGQWYNPKQHFERENAWYVPSTWRLKTPGASCISICQYCSLILDQLGMEGKYKIVALYARPDNPDRALEGGVESDSMLRSVGRQQWELFLVDDRNSRLGQILGWGGMNYYEACVSYEWEGKTYYLPGGTDRIYDNKNQVLKIFRTLAWARWDTWRKEWQVMSIVRTYTPPGRGAPANCEYP